tara:strand:- start:78 stop:572 length:495 start_codon:yes stop_codon:yes gene_type:complete
MKTLIILVLAIYFYRRYKKQNPKITPEQKEELRKEEAARQKRDIQDKKEREDKAKVKRELVLKTLENSNSRVYFSQSFLNEMSELFPLDASTNSVIPEGKTNLQSLYSSGFRLIKAEKTGASAQLDAFNFLLQVERDNDVTAPKIKKRKVPPPPPLPPPAVNKA